MDKISKSLLLLIVCLLGISCSKTKESNFSIEGQIIGLAPDQLVLFQESDIERKISTPIDTLLIDKDGFFKGSYKLEPHLYKLVLNNDHDLVLAIDTTDNVQLKIADLNKKEAVITVSGSIESDKLLAYETFREKSLDSLVQSVRKKIKELKAQSAVDRPLLDSLGLLEVSNYELHLNELNDYIKKYMANSLGLYATSIRWKGEENITLYDSLTAVFESKYPNLAISKKLREKVNRLKQTSLGGQAANIELPNPDGKTINLMAVNKKYILIDFWASWCGPCRRESESLNSLYKKYKDQGFEIYGVSLDDKRDKWIEALEKDKRNWPNVSSLEAFKTQAAYDFAVTALPHNYLIDKDMKILAKNIHGQELEDFLEGLFKQ